MQVNWRYIHAARNTYAILYAACESAGITLSPVEVPADDITCYSLNSINAKQLLPEIASADCLTIAGGPHATACPRETAEYADYVIVGEGEFTLPALLNDIRAGGEGKIPGVMTGSWYRLAETSVRLDAYPPFTEMKGYIEITRGCPFSCGYCQTPQIFGHGMRHRSVDEIARYGQKHEQLRFVSPNAFAYGSDGIHPRWEKVESLLKKCGHQIFFGTFPSEVRPEFVCDEGLSLVNRYCANTKIHFGAQSGSNDVLKKLGRGHTVEDVLQALDRCKEYSFTPVVDFIVGLPFETDEDQLATLEMIRTVVRTGKVHVHRFIPLPGTPLAGMPVRTLLLETEKTCGNLALSGKLTGSWTDTKQRFRN